MIYISNANDGTEVINLNRGDDAVLTMSLTTSDGQPYEMEESEYLIFGVKETPTDDAETLIEIISEPGSNIIEFKHEDTNDLDTGFYSAEIQLMFGNGKRNTVWPKLTGNTRTSRSNRKNFCLMTEVVRE